jgi:hypothetical protein
MMHIDAKHENVRTLAASMGIDQDQAATLLNKSVILTAARDDACATTLCKYLQRHLAVILAHVSTASDARFPPDLEVVVGAANRRTPTDCVWVAIEPGGITIDRSAIVHTPATTGVHQALLLLGSCYAAGAALKAAFGDMLPVSAKTPLILRFQDIVDQEMLLDPLELGTAYLAGAGAVGNAFVLALSTFDVGGMLHIVDPDIVSGGNLQRCWWFLERDIGRLKTDQLTGSAQLHFRRLHLISRPVEVRELSEHRNGQNWLERLIVAVDSRRARRNLQLEVPREVYDASTTGIEEIVLHFNHACSDAACLGCIYAQDPAERTHETHVADLLGVLVEDVRQNFISPTAARKICVRYPNLSPDKLAGSAFDSLFKALCGQGQLRSGPDRQVMAPFSFVSVLAGTYLAIEMILRVRQGMDSARFNYWRVSPWSNPVLTLRTRRPSLSRCEYCSSPIFRKVRQDQWCSTSHLRKIAK